MDGEDEEFVVPYPPDEPPDTLEEKDKVYRRWFEAAYEGDAHFLLLWVQNVHPWDINQRGRAVEYEQYYETRNSFSEQFFHFYYENYFGERIEDTTEYYGINAISKMGLGKWRWRQGFTALEYAAMMNRFEAVQTLLLSGATDYSALQEKDKSALDFIHLVAEDVERIRRESREQH